MEGKLTNVLMGTEKTALFIRLFICPPFPVVAVVMQKSFFAVGFYHFPFLDSLSNAAKDLGK